MRRRGKGGGTPSSPFQAIHERLDLLEGAIGDVHPDYALRAVRRMEELAKTTQEQANSVLEIVNNQRVALGTVVHQAGQVQDELDKACTRLQGASDRHQQEAQDLRVELGKLREEILQQAEHVQNERRACEDALEAKCHRCEQTLQEMQQLYGLYEAQQEEVIFQSRHIQNDEDLVAVIERAQSVSQSRSPSSRRVAASMGLHNNSGKNQRSRPPSRGPADTRGRSSAAGQAFTRGRSSGAGQAFQ